MGTTPAIDWATAQRVGELIAGSPPSDGLRAGSIQPLAHDFARRVSDYTGLALPAQLPPLEAVDRPAWIAANLKSTRPLLDSLAESAKEPPAARETGRPAAAADSPESGARAVLSAAEGLLSGSVQTVSGHLLGAQFGTVTGLFSQRVLGQYDISLLDPETPPRLLLVAPNLAAAARNLQLDRDELVAWVAIHEITHAVQFSGAPWLRDHLGGLIRELLGRLQISVAPRADGAKRSTRLPDARELRELIERGRRGEVLRITLGEQSWQLVEQMQSTMSLIEGHAEHTMDAVGEGVLPSLPRLRAAMTRRREGRGLPWRVLERVLGLELKMRQYEVGRRFCDAVVNGGGPQALALAWRSPAELPSAQELAEPARWLERVGAAA